MKIPETLKEWEAFLREKYVDKVLKDRRSVQDPGYLHAIMVLEMLAEIDAMTYFFAREEQKVKEDEDESRKICK